MKAVILTQGKYVDPKNIDWYTEQVLTEDGLLKEALIKKGFECSKVDWADPDFDWSSVDLAIFRSTWDYFYRFEEFSTWLNMVEGQTKFINPIKQIKWNMDKHYLLDLEAKGIPVVETHFIEQRDTTSLVDLHKQLNWSKTVLKPCISGGGRHTYLLDPSNYGEHEAVFQQVIQNESMMLQPYQEQITEKGEVSHIVIGGIYTHSVLKRAKAGDYRVQDDFGGTVHPYEASEEEKAFAEKVAKCCDPLPSYARIDVIWDNRDQLAISEVELIEPELWFRKYPEAADLLAEVILSNFRQFKFFP